MPASIQDVIKDLHCVLEAERSWVLESEHPEDEISKICSGCVPIYYTELAACLASDTSLAWPDDNIFAGEEEVNVWKILEWTIFERLSGEAHRWLSEAQKQVD